MRIKIVAAVGCALLLATGCANGESGSDDAGAEPASTATLLPQKLTKPATAVVDDEIKPSPAEDAPFAEQLEYELRRRTVKMAHAEGDTTATCPANLASTKSTKATCATTFDGVKVEWAVTIGDNAAWSDNYVQYDATPDRGILTREGVARYLYGNNRDSIDYALCSDIPKAVTVPLDKDNKYRCEVVRKGQKPTGYSNKVWATESGPRSY
ncbi:hypothetical protein EV562_10149 [Streptomyces sp. BK208]|uniref:hypothetical protein n=1 Tax=Streptomyces sp. BK208 TaxID=2512150 RepID=UPI00105E5DFF|nr:hypothetical protein [Streptomyces sp. BK208]TDT42080.1 hypothetical protein EV562_10149 [Streptomyces sp. BK208]